MSELVGHISQIIGPVVDVYFELSAKDETRLPAIHDALSIDRGDGRELIVEIQQHIGENTVRTVAMDLINGAVFMVHGDFLKAIGGFDEGAFMYHEELVLGHQVRQAGRECAVITATEVHHLQGHATGYTSKAFSVRFCREQARGEAYYVRRCLRGNFLLVTLLYAVRAVDAVSKLALFGLGLRGRRTARPARRPVRAGL